MQVEYRFPPASGWLVTDSPQFRWNIGFHPHRGQRPDLSTMDSPEQPRIRATAHPRNTLNQITIVQSPEQPRNRAIPAGPRIAFLGFGETPTRLSYSSRWKVIFGHFVNHFENKNDRAAIFNTQMSDGGHLVFTTIDLKWREMHYEVIFVHQKWSPATIFLKNCHL